MLDFLPYALLTIVVNIIGWTCISFAIWGGLVWMEAVSLDYVDWLLYLKDAVIDFIF